VILFISSGAMKATLSAIETERIYKKVFSKCGTCKIIVTSDGGDGFLDTVKRAMPELKEKKYVTLSADMKKIKAKVLLSDKCAFIESSLSAGVCKGKMSILKRSTAGVGILINKLYDGKKKVYVGIGGTMTADMGRGMLEILGFETESYSGTNVLKSIKKNKKYPLLLGISDVISPLNGHNGSSLYFSQKRADKSERILLQAFFDETSYNIKIQNKKFLGSGGGLGAGIFLAGGKIADSFSFLNGPTGLREMLNKANIVIVNEGSFDAQSSKGKITGRIVKKSLKMKKRVIVLSGSFDSEIKGVEFIKVKIPRIKNRIGYKKEFEKAAIKTRELIYG